MSPGLSVYRRFSPEGFAKRKESCVRLIENLKYLKRRNPMEPKHYNEAANCFHSLFPEELEALPDDLVVLLAECKLKGLL